MEVIQLQVTRGLSVEQTVEEMIEETHKTPDRAHDFIAYAHQLQAYAGEPLPQAMGIREAGEVLLKRLLFQTHV